MDHVVRADLERDEHDLTGMRFHEGDRRVELRAGPRSDTSSASR